MFLCEVDFPNYELMNENAELSQMQTATNVINDNNQDGSLVSNQTLDSLGAIVDYNDGNIESNQSMDSSSNGNVPDEEVELANNASAEGYDSQPVEEIIEKKRFNYLDKVEKLLNSLKNEDKPWMSDSSLTNHHFNFGFTEATWLKYCERRRELGMIHNQLSSPVVKKQVESVNAQLPANHLSVPPEASPQENDLLVALPPQKDASIETPHCQMDCDPKEMTKESLENGNPDKKPKEKRKMHKKKAHRPSPYAASISRESDRRSESSTPQDRSNPNLVDSKRRCDRMGDYGHARRRAEGNMPARNEHHHYASSLNSRGYDDYNDYDDYNHCEPYPSDKGRSNHGRGAYDWQTSNENNSCSRNNKRKRNDFQHPIHKRPHNMWIFESADLNYEKS